MSSRTSVPESVKKEEAGQGVSGEKDKERLTVGDDLPESEADATGAQISFGTTTRTEICATPSIRRCPSVWNTSTVTDSRNRR
jgi:hypothetical protein